MNALRSSPLRCLLLASALQVFIFSCCLLMSSFDMPLDDRQVDMNDLRWSPLSPRVFASAAQDFIISCWLFRCVAAAGVAAAGVAVCAAAAWLATAATTAPRVTSHVEGLIQPPLRRESCGVSCYAQTSAATPCRDRDRGRRQR